MYLQQTLSEAVNGYWDGGPKRIFNWHIDGAPRSDHEGQYVRIGSWEANHWFHVAQGKTIKRTLANAKLHLKAITRLPSTFEYIED